MTVENAGDNGAGVYLTRKLDHEIGTEHQNYIHLLSYKNINTRVSLLSLGPQTGTVGQLGSLADRDS